MKKIYRLPTHAWTVERSVFLVAGVFIFLSVLLGYHHHPYWFYFTGLVGLMMIFFSLTGWCPMAIILQKIFHLPSLDNPQK